MMRSATGQVSVRASADHLGILQRRHGQPAGISGAMILLHSMSCLAEAAQTATRFATHARSASMAYLGSLRREPRNRRTEERIAFCTKSFPRSAAAQAQNAQRSTGYCPGAVEHRASGVLAQRWAQARELCVKSIMRSNAVSNASTASSDMTGGLTGFVSGSRSRLRAYLRAYY